MGLCAVRRAVAGDGVAEMPGERLHRVLAAFCAGGDVWSSAWLCGVCPGIAGVNGAGVMLMSGEIPRGSLCTSDEVSRLIEELRTPSARARAWTPTGRTGWWPSPTWRIR
jgi:hypothetical protein